ncbi:MAG: pyridoxal-phosphate dependent enzyme [Clostridiales bacterium]|nr:pyridoxal-phosphate dependent enzyme [Clostridiales bacterium]
MTTLTSEEKALGVMTVSSGNHGAAVSYASKLLGIEKADIIVPKVTPQSKIDNIKFYGANVLVMGNDYDEAHKLGEEYKLEHNMTYIDAYYEDEEIYAGQGTIGLEIIESMPDVDIILVPVGGGGMITGIGTAVKSLKPDVKIVGLQTSACPAMIKAIEDNVFYEEYPIDESICDALVGGIGKRAFDMKDQIIDYMIEVDEKEIFEATKNVVLKENIIAEPSSSLYAVAIKKNIELFKGKKCVAVISGGNIDSKILEEIRRIDS